MKNKYGTAKMIKRQFAKIEAMYKKTFLLPPEEAAFAESELSQLIKTMNPKKTRHEKHF